MRGALIHGVLLAVMLVYGYRTWTRDKTTKPDLGSVVLWDKAEKDIVSIAFKNENREVMLQQRTANGETYWWGSDTQITKQPKAPATPPTPPPPPPGQGSGSAAGSGAGSGSAAPPPPTPGSGAAGSNAGSAGSGAGSGSAAPPEPPKPPEMEEVRKTREFPLGENGAKIVKSYAAARAMRDLGTLDEAKKKTYKLDAPKSSITITFKDGARTFQLGDAVFGNQDKYAIDDKGRGYVLSKDMLTNLELGEQSLFLADARGFDAKKIEAVTIEGAGKTKTGIRMTTDVEGKPVKTWADAATKKPHPSLGNYIDQLGSMPPSEYSPKTKLEGLTKILTATYKDGDGAKLGTLTLYKGPKAPPAAGEPPPPPGPKSDFEYYIMTEKSRVPAIVRPDTAQQVETNLPVIMNEKPPEPGAAPAPKGNPFGSGAMPPPGHGGAPPDPHGVDDGHGHGTMQPPPTPPAPPVPAGGSAAKPAPAGGSAAKPAPAGGSAAKPAPAGGSAAKPAPAAPAAGSAAKPPAPKAAPAGSAAPANP
jgi:Domain of unknown function (DUF4340)